MQELYNEIVSVMSEIDLQEEADLFKDQNNIYNYILSAPYYKALAAYCKLKSPQKILEIGTCSAASAACLSKYSSNILTLDVDLSNVKNFEIIEKRGVAFKKIVSEDLLEMNFSDYDFIFIDIDHTGSTEILLHNLLKLSYTGYVFWDDVQMNLGMKSFWDNVDCPKMVTDWHFTGFGIVQY